ncbi:unnamed protein product [Psylliodes chrysocephalus]|uniref:tRNA (guanine-N(7)-)-methyltransferase non-catalytic subunit wuho n=1 Tax=Psylliodes chrysocephalus TaxID=3402493 RepID=A0A9P0GKT3_9CUCU|nr:unnamed protein product [Psylliodes chrysocephala]
MVLLKTNDFDLYIAFSDNIIRYNTEDLSDIHVKIQKPAIPDNLKQSQIEVINKEHRTITSLEFSPSGKYIVVSTENKQIIVYDKNFNTIKNMIANRSPSKACFTPSDDIIIADKTGDVYLYKLQDEENKPVLLLGHLSVILDIAISDCGKYIITSDRDEKIRVSHFPNCYNIASYCLGHTEFVNKIQVVNNVLVSASGDGTIRFWDFLRGTQLGIIDTNIAIEQKDLLHTFFEQMNKEKVEVHALPITDMQIRVGNITYIAISMYNYDYIHLYCTDFSDFNSKLITKLKVDSAFSFCLSSNLYVFQNQFSSFKLVNGMVENIECNLDKLHQKYSSLLTSVDNSGFTVLYKRKFDNVQEYLERKKQRS